MIAGHDPSWCLEYYPDHWNDADSIFWKVFVRIMCWPLLIFGMLS